MSGTSYASGNKLVSLFQGSKAVSDKYCNFFFSSADL
jgi:hypothetical protein